MFNRNLAIAATIAAAAASNASAVAPTAPRAATTAPSAKPQQQTPTRAGVLKNLDASFKTIDSNGDGTLSAGELAAAEGKVQQQRILAIRQRVEGEFNKLDTNKDGSLSKAEFMAAAPTSASAAPNGTALVSQLDANKDGKVSADEYRNPMIARFDRIDTNHDGTLSATERQAAASQAPRKN